ncbi:hypothetical protein ACFONG_19810 [Uliginosibacterium paludis]|uniref:Tetratricopeptide repeat protein n=1 Tax=Uliginosibacterium paludis TaxID=1615952 RepID=A0ABV2CUV2_9RHOO
MAEPRSRKQILNLSLVALVCLLAAWGIWQAQRVMRADFTAMQARYRIDGWAAGKSQWTVPAWIEARDDLLEASRIAPDNPLTFDYLAQLNALRGRRAWEAPELRKAYFSDALRFQKISLALRPENGAAWASLALGHFALEDHPAAFGALRQALRYGPYEVPVKQMAEELVLAMWAEAPADLHAWLLQRHRDGTSDEKADIDRLAKRYGVRIQEG